MKTDFEDANFVQGVNHFFEAVFDQYGYDFRNYSNHFKLNRIRHSLAYFALPDIQQLTDRACQESEFFFELLGRLTITVTGLFRDPGFFATLRDRVVPYLRDCTPFKIWHPGCSSGEELISMVILLKEENLLHEAILYGTDINPKALLHARRGIVTAETIRSSTEDYFRSGGKGSLVDYFQVNHGFGLFSLGRERNIVFSEHSLVTDQSFGEMHLIACRNVLIYFGESFRDRALRLLTESLRPGGFLCLGMHESLMFSAVEKQYQVFDERHKIYRKK